VKKKVAAAILTGGKASRYSSKEKGLIEFSPGISIVKHLVQEVRWAGIEEMVLCGGREESYRDLRLPAIPDRFAHKGPLAGIEAALDYFATSFDGVLFLPCDMPAVSSKEIYRLNEAFCCGCETKEEIVTAETGDFFWHPLCSVVHIGLLPEIRKALVEGRLSIGRLWKELDARPVHFDREERFININSPEDLSAFLKRKENV